MPRISLTQSDADCGAFWSLRDDVEQVMRGGLPVVFDISLPISEMENFADNLRTALPGAIGEHRLWIFGHLGDGNLHVIVQVRTQDNMVLWPKIEALVYSPLAAFDGSVSAEHGKKAYLKVSRGETEIALMRTLKAALDPRGILNPGKIL